MYPVLRLGIVSIGTHEFFVGLGVLMAAVVVLLETRRRGVWGDGPLVALAGALIGGAFGMHATSWLRSPTDAMNHDAWQVWQYGAKSILGGLTGAYLGVLIAKRLIGYRQSTGDLFAPGVALGMAVGRIGCLLTEPPGRATSVPWAIHLSDAQITAIPGCTDCVAGVGYHPSFGYEIAFQLTAFAVLIALRSRLPRPGSLFLVYLTGYAAFRFGVEFTRANETVFAGLTRGQWFIAALSPLLVRRLFALRRNPSPAVQPRTAPTAPTEGQPV